MRPPTIDLEQSTMNDFVKMIFQKVLALFSRPALDRGRSHRGVIKDVSWEMLDLLPGVRAPEFSRRAEAMPDGLTRPGQLLLTATVVALSMGSSPGCIVALEPDQDGDTYPARWDCDDLDARIHPQAQEACDGQDNDCDGLIDDADGGGPLAGVRTWYADQDHDDYGDINVTTFACLLPAGYGVDSSDCDDRNPAVHPGMLEYCDGLDNDCDGSVDDQDQDSTPEGVQPWYADVDGDTYGNAVAVTLACNQPEGSVAASLSGFMDCDDGDATVHPGAIELCDSQDNDCDGRVDDTTAQAALWYADVDQDGYGDDGEYVMGCPGPTGWASVGGDCNDQNAASHAGAPEVCDDLDNDCDGYIDEAVIQTWYPDQDGDGYGTVSGVIEACEQPEGYAALSGDCDDASATSWPGAPIQCDGRDNNCDGVINYATTPYFRDADQDGFGSQLDRTCSPQVGYTTTRGDCDDADADIHPGAIDPIDDGIDQDCGGTQAPEPHVGYSPGSFSTLQAALIAANEGVVVWVGPGVYVERDVSFQGKALTLTTSHGPELTTLDVQRSNGNGFIFNTNEGLDSVLDGFGITGVGGSSYRVAINVVAASPTVSNCHIYANYVLSSGNGAGMYLKWSSAVVRDCVFENNNVVYGGGAVYMDSSSPIFERCTFAHNSAQWGGGLYSFLSRPVLTGCRFSENVGTSSAGGLYLYRSEAQLRYNDINANIGGGLFAYDDDSIIRDTQLRDNDDWGAITSDYSKTRFENCTFADTLGTGLILWSSTSQVINSVISGNRSSSSGGGVWISGGAPAFLNTLIHDNESLDDGGGVYLDGGEPSFTHCVVSRNTASDGAGGIRVDDSDGTDLVISDSILAYNDGYNLSMHSGLDTTWDLEADYSVFYNPSEENLKGLDEALNESNLLIEPMFLTVDSQGAPLDFHLAVDSPLIGHGSPVGFDFDGSPTDPGLYGGPAGASFDQDRDGYPAYFWPGPFSDVPPGVDPALFDADDTDPAVPIGGYP